MNLIHGNRIWKSPKDDAGGRTDILGGLQIPLSKEFQIY